jgi:hypothetical protein
MIIKNARYESMPAKAIATIPPCGSGKRDLTARSEDLPKILCLKHKFTKSQTFMP